MSKMILPLRSIFLGPFLDTPKFGWCVENATQKPRPSRSDSLFPPGSPMVSPWPYGMPQMSPMSPMSPMTPMTPMVRGSSAAANPVGVTPKWPWNRRRCSKPSHESWFLLVHGEKLWFLDVNPHGLLRPTCGFWPIYVAEVPICL